MKKIFAFSILFLIICSVNVFGMNILDSKGNQHALEVNDIITKSYEPNWGLWGEIIQQVEDGWYEINFYDDKIPADVSKANQLWKLKESLEKNYYLNLERNTLVPNLEVIQPPISPSTPATTSIRSSTIERLYIKYVTSDQYPVTNCDGASTLRSDLNALLNFKDETSLNFLTTARRNNIKLKIELINRKCFS